MAVWFFLAFLFRFVCFIKHCLLLFFSRLYVVCTVCCECDPITKKVGFLFCFVFLLFLVLLLLELLMENFKSEGIVIVVHCLRCAFLTKNCSRGTYRKSNTCDKNNFCCQEYHNSHGSQVSGFKSVCCDNNDH